MAARIVVLGMHRSGTSVLTRLVNLLGVPLCQPEDLYTQWDNPSGHWESKSLIDFNNRLLGLCGGNWRRPPRLNPGWTSRSEVAALVPEAQQVFSATHTGNEWVWKDPRTCLTLDFWRRAVGPTAVMLVTRNPRAVALSLQRRDRFRLGNGLALWERYTRSALSAAEGLPLVVMRYEDVVADPANGVAQLVDRFAAIGLRLAGDETAARESVQAGGGQRETPDIRLSRSQQELETLIAGLPSVTESFRIPALPRESRWLQFRFRLPDRLFYETSSGVTRA